MEILNNKVLKIFQSDDIKLSNFDEDDYNECFENYSEQELTEDDEFSDPFLRFLKSDEYDNVHIFNLRKNDDFFIIKKGDELTFINVYQISNYYEDDGKVTFCGWDYNVIVNLEDMSIKTVYVR